MRARISTNALQMISHTQRLFHNSSATARVSVIVPALSAVSVAYVLSVGCLLARQGYAQDAGFGGTAPTNPTTTIPSSMGTTTKDATANHVPSNTTVLPTTNETDSKVTEKTNITESTRTVVAPVPTGLAEKPLYQLRLRVAELQKIYDQLADDGALASIVEEAYLSYKKEQDTLNVVDQVAAIYLKKCLQRHGINTVAPIVQMTPAGPRWMSPSEIMQSQAQADPEACDRLNWVDQKLIDEARRLVEVEELLEKNNFHYGQEEERTQLEEERVLLRQRFGLPRW